MNFLHSWDKKTLRVFTLELGFRQSLKPTGEIKFNRKKGLLDNLTNFKFLTVKSNKNLSEFYCKVVKKNFDFFLATGKRKNEVFSREHILI